VTARPYLDLGTHHLYIHLDAENNVDETDEHDNTFSIQYTLTGQCGATPPTPTPRPSSPVH